jgi:hypothetical protein
MPTESPGSPCNERSVMLIAQRRLSIELLVRRLDQVCQERQADRPIPIDHRHPVRPRIKRRHEVKDMFFC